MDEFTTLVVIFSAFVFLFGVEERVSDMKYGKRKAIGRDGKKENAPKHHKLDLHGKHGAKTRVGHGALTWAWAFF